MDCQISMHLVSKIKQITGIWILHAEALVSTTLIRIHGRQFNRLSRMHHLLYLGLLWWQCVYGPNRINAPCKRINSPRQRLQLTMRHSIVSVCEASILRSSFPIFHLCSAWHSSICAKPVSLLGRHRSTGTHLTLLPTVTSKFGSTPTIKHSINDSIMRPLLNQNGPAEYLCWWILC